MQWKSTLTASFPGLVALLLPKCPLCWIALLSAVGLRSALAAWLLYPLALACLAPAGALLAMQARRHRAWGPFWLYVPAAILLLVGKFYLAGSGVVVAAAGLLAVAIMWSAWRYGSAAKC